MTIEVFFPANASIEVWDPQFGNAVPCPANGKRLLLFYGDSITQSAYTTTPSCSFPTLTASLLDADYRKRGGGSLFYNARALDMHNTPLRLRYWDGLRNIAAQHGMAFIDGFTLLVLNPAHYVEDGVHLSAIGAEVVAHALAAYLSQTKSPRLRTFCLLPILFFVRDIVHKPRHEFRRGNDLDLLAKLFD